MAKKKDESMDLVKKITLDLVFVGTKETNFRILKMLPTDVKKVMKETGLTKVPANNRINELEKYGLLKRKRTTGKVYPTKLTKMLLRAVKKISKKFVEPCLNEILPDLIN